MKIISAVFILFLGMVSRSCAQDLAESVRELNAAQNHMAIGREKAKDRVAKQFDAIEALIPALEPESWKQSRNIRAAAIYLLGGGAPEQLREIFDAGFIVGEDASVLEAALLNAEGDARAAERISAFDPAQYPALLGGHLALVQGDALVGQDNPRAIAKLDLARLLMPTSLVEEAALRREIRVLDPQTQREKIATLALIYASRYRASPYARHLITELRALLFSPGIDADPTLDSKLESVIDIASAPERLDIYLALCRAALAAGRFDEARRRLAKARPAAETGEMHERLSAYENIFAHLDSPERPQSSVKVAQTSAALTAEDKRIIALVQSVLSRLAMAPTEPHDSENEPSQEEESELFVKARVRIEHVDRLLNGKKTK